MRALAVAVARETDPTVRRAVLMEALMGSRGGQPNTPATSAAATSGTARGSSRRVSRMQNRGTPLLGRQLGPSILTPDEMRQAMDGHPPKTPEDDREYEDSEGDDDEEGKV